MVAVVAGVCFCCLVFNDGHVDIKSKYRHKATTTETDIQPWIGFRKKAKRTAPGTLFIAPDGNVFFVSQEKQIIIYKIEKE